MDENQDGEWLRLVEAAKLAGKSRASIYRWVERLEREGVIVRRLDAPRRNMPTILIERGAWKCG